MKQYPITVTFNEEPQQAQATALPQAQLLTGATGYVLAIQIGSRVYTATVPAVIQGLVAATQPAPKAEEEEVVEAAS